MIAEFVISLALLAVELLLVGLGVLVLAFLWFAVSEALTKRSRVTVHPGRLPDSTYRRFTEASTWTSLDDARRAAWERRSRT